MESLEQIYILNNLSDDVWRFATGLIDVVEWFDRADNAEKETVKVFYMQDAINRLEMWRTLISNHTQLWEDSLNEIDLTEVNVELLDDCPDNDTLQNRLRIVKNRYCGTWRKTRPEEREAVFNKLLHIVDRLTEILFSVYDWSEDDAHRKAVKWHGYLLQKWFRVVELQTYMQAVIDNAESLLLPQPDTTTEQEQRVKQSSITDNEEIKEIFEEAVKRGFMSCTDKGFKWLKSNQLLAYFCVKLSTYQNLSEKMYEDNDATNWSYFSGVFLTKRQGGKWVLADAVKLHDYKFGNMRGQTKFLPKGYERIDDLILEFS